LSKYEAPEVIEHIVDQIEKRNGWLIECVATGLELQEIAFEMTCQNVLLLTRKTLTSKTSNERATA